MRCFLISSMKFCGAYRANADLQKCGLFETKFSGLTSRLVKLQRPPPEIIILRPTCALCSKTKTLRPRFPASIAQKSPAAPAPMMMTSNFISNRISFPQNVLVVADVTDHNKSESANRNRRVARRAAAQPRFFGQIFEK